MKSFKGKITTRSEATVYDSRILMCPPKFLCRTPDPQGDGTWLGGGGTLGGNQVVSVEPHEGVQCLKRTPQGLPAPATKWT